MVKPQPSDLSSSLAHPRMICNQLSLPSAYHLVPGYGVMGNEKSRRGHEHPKDLKEANTTD